MKTVVLKTVTYEEFIDDNILQIVPFGVIKTFSVEDFLNICLVYKEKTIHFRIPLFYEIWVERYLDYDFFIHFRMTKGTFKNLVSKLGLITEVRRYPGGNPLIPLEKEVLVTLWYLAKGDSLVSTGDRFNIATSAVYYSTTRIINVLIELMPTYIKWPSERECAEISRTFKSRANFPDVIGAIDGSHLKCKIPKEQHDSYQDRKFDHSINLQGICTADRLLINVYVGCPGSVHDARVLRESNLFNSIERYGKNKFFYGKYHLVGDSAYPLKTWLMTSYKDYGNLTPQQKKYNYSHSVTRVVIENVFAMLKGRWRILMYVNVYSIQKAIKIISACCLLHNFCLLNLDTFENELGRNPLEIYGLGGNQDQVYIGYRNNDGLIKRDYISTLL